MFICVGMLSTFVHYKRFPSNRVTNKICNEYFTILVLRSQNYEQFKFTSCGSLCYYL